MATGLLVSYAGYPYALSSLFPDNGLASLAATLRAEGHSCQVLDYNTTALMGRLVDRELGARLAAVLPRLLQADPDPGVVAELRGASARLEERNAVVADEIAAELVARARRERIDFVGFKLWSGDGFDASHRIAGRIRASCPRVRLYAGGPAVHFSGAAVYAEAPVFDAVVDGDGEEALLELAHVAEGAGSLAGVPNLVRPGSVAAATELSDLASLPLPEYGAEVYPSLASGEKLRVFCVDESRGCPMRCAFCINRCIAGGRWRTRGVDQVLAEIRGFRKLGSRAFRLAGTYSPPALVREVCEELIAGRDRASFGLSLHSAGATPELMELLGRAGCYGVFVGVESGSDEILRRLQKSTSAARLRRVLRDAMDRGLFVAGSFIFPAPGESAATEAETKLLIEELFAGNPSSSVIVTFPAVVPRTVWWEERDRFGFELAAPDDELRQLLLRYKIRHLLPPSLWQPLPYALDGHAQPALARRAAELQAWARGRGVTVNVPDHDAMVGAALGASCEAFSGHLRQLIFTADGVALQEIVESANRALAP